MTEDIMIKAFEEITSDSEFFTSKGPGNPRLLVMSGLPMSGKSYLSNLISVKMDGKVCIVRTDGFRPVVAKHMGRNQPMYDKEEHTLVFEIGRRLISAALDNGWSVIADATNLTELYRKWAVDAAKDRSVRVLAAFLEISPETAMDRVREKDRDGSAASPAVYALLSYEKEQIEKCSIHYIVINSEIDVRPWADVLSKWLEGDIDKVAGAMFP
ncbi:MAG: ATP-binding protein [Candidatus Thermoplasmatota archaeon]|nr:ATP-binding protein [Candidatus Thermoplasmatota archaeon]MBU4070990.1 ATP-binding protein [Candidatus Thermoplasmatota archaeon]MBU4144298.1 ATP-binding protein [Candidatus Thermoplasmatota archaeon]MBU4592611.1 ATP-binding protein [Candidatus Thermoplasmatota archaeon]